MVAPKVGAPKAGAKPKDGLGGGGRGLRTDPWKLKTPSGSSDYLMFRDETLDPPALVCVVGKTELRYRLRCLDDLHTMLKQHGDWLPLGSADEQKPAAPGTVEAWARSADRLIRCFKEVRRLAVRWLPTLLSGDPDARESSDSHR